MIERVWSVPVTKENMDYISSARKIIFEEPRLSVYELDKELPEDSLIGIVYDNFFDYEKALSLARFKKLDFEKKPPTGKVRGDGKIWVVVDHGAKGLGIGAKDSNIEVFMESSSTPKFQISDNRSQKQQRSYFLTEFTYKNYKDKDFDKYMKTQCVRIPQNILEKTREFVKES
jgi:hypothetical protein